MVLICLTLFFFLSRLPYVCVCIRGKSRKDTPSVVEVMQVEQGGPAASGGMLPGDWLVAFNGVPVPGMDDLYRLMSVNPPNAEVRAWWDGRAG